MSDSKATQTISGRVAEEDFNFLMAFPIAGQVTASEKLRHALSFFRQYQQSLEEFEECVSAFDRQLEPARKSVKRAESAEGVYSELVDKLLRQAPQLLAFLVATRIPDKEPDRLKALLQFEEKACQQLLGLLESVLRLGLASQSPTYNPTLLRARLKIVQELVDLHRRAPAP